VLYFEERRLGSQEELADGACLSRIIFHEEQADGGGERPYSHLYSDKPGGRSRE
jgi:hypothetical protein